MEREQQCKELQQDVDKVCTESEQLEVRFQILQGQLEKFKTDIQVLFDKAKCDSSVIKDLLGVKTYMRDRDIGLFLSTIERRLVQLLIVQAFLEAQNNVPLADVALLALGHSLQEPSKKMTPLKPPDTMEDFSGVVIKEDYPMSKEELLSQVMKSLQLQDEDELKKLDSSPSLTLSSPQISLTTAPMHSKKTSTVPESILSHKTTRGRGTGSISHVTFGDSASAAGPVALASASASGAPVSSRGSQGARGSFKHTSSSSYLGSTGYLETSRGRESVAGGMGSELSRGLSSSSGHASSAAAASRPSSSTSKDSRGYN